MKVVFIIPPLFPGTTDLLTIEWSEPFLPMPGDTIDIHYFLKEDVYENLYTLMITDYPEITPWEAQYIGESIGYVFDQEYIEVESRYWMGEGQGVMLTCKFTGCKAPTCHSSLTCHSERSEESSIDKGRPSQSEILRLSASE